MHPGSAGPCVTAIRGRRVITPEGERAATVLVREGLIVGLTGYDGAPDGAVTLAGDEVLLPGLVDSHVHVNEPGRTEWEGFATATAAAAAGGVTTIVDMPLNSIPPTVTVPALRAKQAAAAGQLAVDVAFWGGAVPGNVADLRPLHEAGVAGFKCFLLPSGVDEFAPLDQAQLGAAMAEIASFGGLLIAHAEDPGVIEAAPAAGGTRTSWPPGRPRPSSGLSPCCSGRPGGPGAGPTSCTWPARRHCPPSARPRRTGCRSPPRPARTTSPSAPRTSPTAPPSSSAARRSGMTPTVARCGRGCWTARSAPSCPTTHRAPWRPSGSTPGTSLTRGAASPRSSSACLRCGPRPPGAASAWTGWRPGCPRPRPR